MKSNFLEAPVGFEPTNKGFADLPLKPLGYSANKLTEKKSRLLSGSESGKRDSNPRLQPWQGCALPTELFPHLSNKLQLHFYTTSRDINRSTPSSSLGLRRTGN